MPLATLAELKTRLEINGTGADARLAQALADAGALIDQWCGRTLLYPGADVTEDHDGGGFDLRLRYWPVVTVAAAPVVMLATDYDFAGAGPLVENSDYHVNHRRGLVTRLPDRTRWPDGRGIVRVVYRGGYNDPGADPLAGVEYVPAHIRQACLLQAAEMYARAKEPGYKVVAGMAGGMSAGYAPGTELLPVVKELLRSERRG